MKGHKIVALIMVALFVFTGCAKRTTKKAPTPKNVEQTAETKEISLDFLDELDSEDDLFAIGSEDIQFSNDMPSEVVIRESTTVVSSSSYTVRENDTLMYIAYQVYGDYRKWPSLAQRNNLSASTPLKAGTILSIDSALVRAPRNKEGRPYIIRVGDSLSKISMDQYGTFKQWEPLWRHNDDLIKDPNIIFAGFQMYLLPDHKLAINQR